ncbi:MAG: hypothetical protein NVS1B16_05360 [Pseudarthrobacter sp.]
MASANRRPGFQRGQSGGKADGAGDAVEHHICVHRCDACRGIGAGDDLRAVVLASCAAGSFGYQVLQLPGVAGGDADGGRAGVDRLPGEEFQVPAARTERHDFEKVRGAVDDVNRLGADGTGGAE